MKASPLRRIVASASISANIIRRQKSTKGNAMPTAIANDAMTTTGSRVREHINVYALTYIELPPPEFRLDNDLLQQRSGPRSIKPEFEKLESCWPKIGGEPTRWKSPHGRTNAQRT